jgi:acetyl-CoA carboxylase biotin carboxyl carrier protein
MPREPRAGTGRKMDIKDIKILFQLMAENDLGELEIADGAVRVHLKRQGPAAPVIAMPPSPPPAAYAAPAAPPAPASPGSAVASEDLIEIRSPMVGTFYAAPSPDSEPFVQVGAAVREDSVICILEAMKVMNEIKAECSGVIREICLKNAQPVEFGQVLFRVKP